jgi:hypothetical protein
MPGPAPLGGIDCGRFARGDEVPTVTPKPWEGDEPGAPSTTPGPPAAGAHAAAGVGAGDGRTPPQGTPVAGGLGATGVVHALTPCTATGAAATTDERSGPRIQPDE